MPTAGRRSPLRQVDEHGYTASCYLPSDAARGGKLTRLTHWTVSRPAAMKDLSDMMKRRCRGSEKCSFISDSVHFRLDGLCVCHPAISYCMTKPVGAFRGYTDLHNSMHKPVRNIKNAHP